LSALHLFDGIVGFSLVTIFDSVISLHIPLTPATRHTINADELQAAEALLAAAVSR